MRNALIVLLLSACAPAVTPGGTAPDTCGKDDYAALVGANLAAVTLPADLNDRVIGPDDAVTLDFQPDRLNFFVDEAGLITRISCG
ncbi:I78 family peptidase inhibitor [Yoonia sp. 208BN28-4]|uniref:I78 family peptidase inhibitor n=1 Tax=Yoonia sp. 208BN28-4 TaxID=3126505 RepID=UPI003098EFFD